MVGSGRGVQFLTECLDFRGDVGNWHGGCEASIGSVVVVLVHCCLGGFSGVLLDGGWGSLIGLGGLVEALDAAFFEFGESVLDKAAGACGGLAVGGVED